MNLRQIEIFRAIMETGSFTAAAQMLHVSQPGVSRSVRHLEIQLGVALFERKLGRIRVTSEAVALHREIERSYRGVQSIQEFARGLKLGAHAMLRLISSPNTGLEVVPRAIASLLSTNGNTALSLEVMPRASQMIEALISQQADVGISAVALDHPLIESRVIGHWELVCIFPAAHPLARKTKIAPGDTAGEPMVLFHRDTLQGRVTGEWLDSMDVAPTQKVLIRSGQSAAALVASGVGIAFVDDLTARHYECAGLRWRAISQSPHFKAYAAWNGQQVPSRLATKLCDLVRDQFAALPKRPAR